MRLLFLCLAFGWIGGGFELRASVAGRERHSDTDKVIEPTPPSATERTENVPAPHERRGAAVAVARICIAASSSCVMRHSCAACAWCAAGRPCVVCVVYVILPAAQRAVCYVLLAVRV